MKILEMYKVKLCAHKKLDSFNNLCKKQANSCIIIAEALGMFLIFKYYLYDNFLQFDRKRPSCDNLCLI